MESISVFLAQDVRSSGLWEWVSGLDDHVFSYLIPIAAILVLGILGIMKAVFKHRERIAMIQRGMHPDSPPPEDEVR